MGRGIFRNIDCRQTGEARSRDQSTPKPRSGFIINTLSGFIEDDFSNGQSPRANEAHFATQDVDNLWQFVQTGRAENAPHARDALIILLRLSQSEFFIGVRNHGAEFENHELLSKPTPPLLAVKDRASVFEPDGDGDEEGDRGR